MEGCKCVRDIHRRSTYLSAYSSIYTVQWFDIHGYLHGYPFHVSQRRLRDVLPVASAWRRVAAQRTGSHASSTVSILPMVVWSTFITAYFVSE